MNSLLIGGTGSIGIALQTALHILGEVTITNRQEPESSNYFEATTDFSHLELTGFDNVVYAAGLTQFAACESQDELSNSVNYLAPCDLARQSEQCGARFIYFSSTAAARFAGLDANVARQVHAANEAGASTYGLHKYLAECEISKVKSALLVRLSKVVSSEWPLLNDWASQLMSGGTVIAFTDHFFSPITPDYFVKKFTSILEVSATGLLQLSATDFISYYEFAILLCDYLKVPRDRVTGVSAITVLKNSRVILGPMPTTLGETERLDGLPVPSSRAVLTELIEKRSTVN